MTEKNGLAIGIISDGMIPLKWMMHMMTIANGIPSGVFWKYIYHIGKDYRKNNAGWAEARTKIVNQAKKLNVKWLFLVDSDVFIPIDAITRLMSHNKPIVTGVYWMKTYPPQPVIFKKMGAGPLWDIEPDELIEIEGSGCGCVLIDMDVFDKFDEKGIPYFQENWMYNKPDGSKVKVNIGEDHWFFMKAAELGYKIHCDTSCLADHMDFETGAMFPGQDVVNEMRKKALKKHGREDILKSEDELFKIDPEKKTIVFYNPLAVEFSGDELERRGVGGAEGCIINLAKELAKYFNVFVFCNCPRPHTYDNVKYAHLSDLGFLKSVTIDLFVVLRNTLVIAESDFKKEYNIKKLVLWTHDFPESSIFNAIHLAYPHLDNIVSLTNWHKEAIMKKFNLPSDKFLIINNGVDDCFIGTATKERYKLIYSSTPFRGLDVLLDIFPEIKKRVPQANLHIFSSMKVYGVKEEKEFEELYNKARNMEGVSYHGTVTRKELAEHMKTSAIFIYPNHYDETFCISTAEAQSSGTAIVTSKRAALPETILSEASILIDGDAHTFEYKNKFINAVEKLLKDDWLWSELCKEGMKVDYSWQTITKKWTDLFFPEAKKLNVNSAEYWDNIYKYEIEKGIQQRSDPIAWDMIIEEIKDGDSVLDFGCSKGEFLSYLMQKKRVYSHGLDHSKIALEEIKKKAKNINLYKDLKEIYGRFQVITILHTLEHFEDPLKILTDLKEYLMPNGLLAISMPLEDREWVEHIRIWKIEDIINLLNQLDCAYKIIQRNEIIIPPGYRTINGKLNDKPTKIVYDDGKPYKEVIIFARFK